MSRSLRARWLGRQRYEPVLDLQKKLHAQRQNGQGEDVILLVEHDPVITLGRGTKPQHLLASRELLKSRDIDLVEIDRGGDITLHAPGQLVAYPIIDLYPDGCDVRKYVTGLAQAMRGIISPFELDAGLVDGLVGLWVDEDHRTEWPGQGNATHLSKIGAIGVRISRWVTMHGCALNLSTDLRLFELIVPCGIATHSVTSVEALTGKHVTVESVISSAYAEFCKVFDAEPLGIVDESLSHL